MPAHLAGFVSLLTQSEGLDQPELREELLKLCRFARVVLVLVVWQQPGWRAPSQRVHASRRTRRTHVSWTQRTHTHTRAHHHHHHPLYASRR
jgi:hypothetical protein